jgi:hypothetical protein
MGAVVLTSTLITACTKATARQTLPTYRIRSVLAFGTILLKGAPHAVLKLVRTLPAFVVERVVVIRLALLAYVAVLAKSASTNKF